MTCFTYAKSVWVNELRKTWKGSGSDANGPALYTSWTGSKTTSAPSRSSVPCIVIYTGGSDGHTGVITEYTNGQFRYKDYNGKNTNGYDERLLDEDGVMNLFNSRTYKGICY